MLRPLWSAVAALTILVTATAVHAGDQAYLIGNDEYIRMENVTGARSVRPIANILRDRGYDVTVGRDLTARRLADHGAYMLQEAKGADRLIILVAGHIVSSPEGVWLLGKDSHQINRMNVGQHALSLNAVMDIAGGHPGRAIVFVADSPQAAVLGADVQEGVQRLQTPQGVTLIQGPIAELEQFLKNDLFNPDRSIQRSVAKYRGRLKISGYVPPSPWVTDAASPRVSLEDGYWAAVQDFGTLAAYEMYLKRFPDGPHAGQARQRVAVLGDPAAIAREAEQALGLTRDERRQVQRDLDLLGFDPRGVDGIFGRGTRSALVSWQKASGLPQTGYLNRSQLKSLRQAAINRADQLQREAEERQRAERAADRKLWRSVKEEDTAAAYRRYLKRYPDGLNAAAAQERLNAIEKALRQQAAREERDAWDRAVAANTVPSYQQYLGRYPRGRFADAARDRITDLQQQAQNGERFKAFQKEEQAVVGNGAMALVVETRLRQLGYETGPIDGKFSEQTRKAIRQYQRAVNIDVSGYVNQRTLVLLLSGRK